MKKKNIKSQDKVRIRSSSNLFTLRKIFFVIMLLFMTALTIIVAQNRQSLKQYAEVSDAVISPQYDCFGLGIGNCGVKTSSTTTCPPPKVTTALVLKPTSLQEGQQIEGTVTYSNTCTNNGYNIYIGATAPNSNKIYQFTPTGVVGAAQQVPLPATLTIPAGGPAGNWSVRAYYIDSSGNSQPLGNAVPFTVCGPLTVSTVTLNPTSLNPGQTVTGSVTFTNSCKAPFVVQDMKIQATTPKLKDGSTNIDLFKVSSPTTTAVTIPANGSQTVKASYTTSTDSNTDPLGQYKTLGYYKNALGVWVSGKKASIFTLAAKSATGSGKQVVAKPPAGTNNTCTLPAALKNAVTIASFASYMGGTVTVPSGSTGTLTSYATAMKSNTSVLVTINGYTDATTFTAGSTGAITNNQQLSLARATATKNYLVSKGATAKNITTKGNGVAPGAKVNQAANRKVVLTAACSASGTTSGTPATTGKTPANPATTTCTASTPNCQSSACTALGGTCENVGTHTSGGSYVSGICPGQSTWECWAPVNPTSCGKMQEQYCSVIQSCYPVDSTCPSACSSFGGQCLINTSKAPIDTNTYTPVAGGYCSGSNETCYVKK